MYAQRAGDRNGTAEFLISGGNLCRNKAQNGGGAYLENKAKLSFEKGTLTGNTATEGGGVYSKGDVILTGGSLSGNEAQNGGGIYSEGSITMTGGTVSGNSAGYRGGGIMVNGSFTLSGGSLYGNTDTDNIYPLADEESVTPGPNDIYLTDKWVITIPAGGISLSGEERVAIDCDNDGSMRFKGYGIPRRFAEYANPGADFHADHARYFTYYGTRSTQYSTGTLGKNDLKTATHTEAGLQQWGLYLIEDLGGDTSSYVIFDLNYPRCPVIPAKQKKVGEKLNIRTEIGSVTREATILPVGQGRPMR